MQKPCATVGVDHFKIQHEWDVVPRAGRKKQGLTSWGFTTFLDLKICGGELKVVEDLGADVGGALEDHVHLAMPC